MGTDRSKYLYRKTVGRKLYLFFRYRGALTALPTDQSSAEFAVAYDAALRQAKLVAAVAPAAVPLNAPNTLLAGIDAYLNSSKFNAMKPRTKKQYRHMLDQIKAHRIAHGRLATLDTDAVDIYTDEIGVEHGTSVARAHKTMLGNIWTACRPHAQFGLKGKSNPTRDAIKRYEVKRRARPWPVDVQEAFMRAAPAHIKLAKTVLHYSTQRGSDCVRMQWADYAMRDDADGNPVQCILIRQEKTNGEADPLPLVIECVKPLREALDRLLRSGVPLAKTLLTDSDGKSWADANSLSKAIHRVLVSIGAEGYSMHGLRATGATDVANLGGGVDGVKSFTGHRSDDEANYYAQDHDRRIMNAQMRRRWDAKLEKDARKKLALVRAAGS